jgi:hypothetical protein
VVEGRLVIVGSMHFCRHSCCTRARPPAVCTTISMLLMSYVQHKSLLSQQAPSVGGVLHVLTPAGPW